MSWIPPTLVLIWLMGVILSSICAKMMINENPLVRMSCELQPWRAALIALFVVAWPGTLFVAAFITLQKRRS